MKTMKTWARRSWAQYTKLVDAFQRAGAAVEVYLERRQRAFTYVGKHREQITLTRLTAR